MGIQDKNKIHICQSELACHVCDGYHGYEIIDRYRMFHVFFLPLWTWGHAYFIKCQACGSQYGLKSENQYKASEMCGKLSYWDLEPIILNSNSESLKTCKHCGFKVEDEFEFCPKCGLRIKD